MDNEDDHISIDSGSSTSTRPLQPTRTVSKERSVEGPTPGAYQVQGLAPVRQITRTESARRPTSQPLDALRNVPSENNDLSNDTIGLAPVRLIITRTERARRPSMQSLDTLCCNKSNDAKRFKRRVMCWLAGVGFAVACIAPVVALGRVISLENLSVSPTTAPSDFPSASPTCSEVFLVELIQSRSPTTSFVSSTSAQSRALEWMISDPYTLALEDDRLVQRFALATLWHSTNGATWSTRDTGDIGWLEPMHECDWDEFGHRKKKDLRCNTNDQLIEINLSGHGLSGNVPAEMYLLSQLEQLDLSDNSLTGNIPTELGLLTELETLILYNNNLSGTIPTHVGLLTDLGYLQLDHNTLTGSVPTELGLLAEISELFLEYNTLTGSIPTEVGLLTNLIWLEASHNVLSGNIPSEIGVLEELTWVGINDNALSGSIPTEMGLLTGFDLYLELGNNDLSGTMPSSLCGLDFEPFIDCGEIVCTCCRDGPNGSACLSP